MKRMLRAAGLALSIASTVGGGAARAADTPAPVSAPAAASGRQGIVLFTIDSLRADHVGCYAPGNAGVTPAIDLLAATGVRFERAYTASVSTTPSAASILTGVLPSAHGLRDDLSGRMRSGIPTVADRLRAAGWSTAAVVGTERVDSVRGLASGFDLYDDAMKGIRKPVAGLSKERRAAEVADRALQVFEGLANEKPFFLWLHFHDPHYDYDPAEPQKSAYPASPYDGEVAAADAALGSVVRSLRDRLPGARILFVVAGTHGEGLGERKEAGHGFYLNEGTTRVPLIMALARRGPEAGRVVSEPASLLDLAPTILEFAGLPAVSGLAGISQAAALAPDDKAAGTAGSRKGKRAPARRLYVEAAAPAAAYGWSPLFSVTEASRRVVQGARLESFDLEADPAATSPLPTTPRWAKDLVDYGRTQFGTLGPTAAQRAAIDAAVLALQPPWTESPFCVERDTHPDPRDPLPMDIQEDLFKARAELAWTVPGLAWKRGEPLLEKDPANPTALETVIALALRNHWSDGQILDPLEILTCQYPYRPAGYHFLGHFYAQKRNWDQALRAFTLMGMTDPDDEEADYDLACTYAAMGRADEAIEALKRSIGKGSDDYETIRRDSRLGPLRADPRFQALVPQKPQ